MVGKTLAVRVINIRSKKKKLEINRYLVLNVFFSLVLLFCWEYGCIASMSSRFSRSGNSTTGRYFLMVGIYFYHRTLSALLTIACPVWSPVRDLGSPRDLWHRETKLRVLVRGVLLGRGAAVRVLLATCAPNLCASEVLRKPELFPPRTERVRGVASVGRSGPGELR